MKNLQYSTRKCIDLPKLILGVVGLIFIGKLYPCVYTFVWFNNTASLICMLFCFLYILINFNRVPHLGNGFLLIMGIWWFYHIARVFIYSEPESLETANSIIYSLLFICFSLTALGYNKTWKYFLWFHVIMLILSIIGMVLLMYGVPLKVISDYNINEHQRILNFGLFFMKTHNVAGVDYMNYVRPGGFYDEPGSFAFMIFLILMINKLYIKNKYIEYGFLLGGFVTLSLAHFVTAFLYYLFFILKRNNVLVALSVFLGVFLLYTMKPTDTSSFLFSVWDMLFGRIEDFISGNDESRDYNASYEVFKDNFILGGNQMDLLKKYPNATRQTIWFFLGRYGIVGSLIYSIIFIYPLKDFIRDRDRDGLKMMALLIINFLQRPYLHFPIILLPIYLAFFSESKLKEQQYAS